MDIQKIDKDNEPGYPTLDKHRVNRRSIIKTIVGGLAAAGFVGCGKDERPSLPGETCCPAPPKNPEPHDHPVTKGEMPAPKPPDQPRKTAGEMPAPKAPDQPRMAGRMPAPKKVDEPRIAGGMPAPRKVDDPGPHEHPKMKGVMMAPEPPKK